MSLNQLEVNAHPRGYFVMGHRSFGLSNAMWVKAEMAFLGAGKRGCSETVRLEVSSAASHRTDYRAAFGPERGTRLILSPRADAAGLQGEGG